MPVDKIKYLGACIRTARKHCGLTQQELADQSGVSVKTIRNIETGKMNPSYEILFPIINRLGLSTSDLFNLSPDEQEEEIQRFIGKFRACNRTNQLILLGTLDYLAEQLLAVQNKSNLNVWSKSTFFKTKKNRSDKKPCRPILFKLG